MKKVRFMIPVLALLAGAVLNACSPETKSVSSSQAIVSQEEKTASLRLLQSGYPLGTSSDEGYYYLQYREDASQNIYYIEYASRQKIVLCSQPNCKHNSDTCTAWLPDTGSTAGLYAINGKLYIVSYGSVSAADYELFGAAAAPKIEVRHADGSDPAVLLELSPDCYFSGNFAADDLYLYGMLRKVQIVENEGADTKTQLVRISLKKGNLEVLEEFDQLELSIAGAFGKYLVISHSQLDSADGSMLPSTLCYEAYDVTTGGVSPLCTFARADGSCICVGDGLFYFDKSTGEVTAYSIETGEGRFLYGLPLENYSDFYCSYALTDDILMLLYPKDPEANVVHALLSIDSGELFEITQWMHSDETENGKTQTVEIAAETEEDFLILSGVRYQNTFFKISDTESVALPAPCYEFSMIGKTDFTGGRDAFLQIEDLA